MDAMEIMERGGIARDFIEQAIPEFILYWRERGARAKELNSKFIQHIRIQWARYSSSLEHSTEPKRIVDHWQPSEDVYDILRMSHIDLDFARACCRSLSSTGKTQPDAHLVEQQVPAACEIPLGQAPPDATNGKQPWRTAGISFNRSHKG